MAKVTRRDFLRIVAVSGAAGLALKLGLDSLATGEMVSETRLLMGTVVNIKAISPDPKTASTAINICFSWMSALESILSRFQPESQLSRLNQAGALKDAHPSLVSLIQQSQELSLLSDGAFDITVKPLLDLYQAGDTLPSDEQIQATRSLVDYRKLHSEKSSIRFENSGMSISLDGIAKGYIVDEGVAVLRGFGFGNVMVEAGGDLMALGEKAPRSPWEIGLQAPRAGRGNLAATFSVQNQAIATSGDYMQAFTADFSQHHILDPRTGYSSPELASASVTAPTVAIADGLATAVMVMGWAGLELIEKLPNCEAYAIDKEGVVFKTSGFQGS